MSLPRSASVSTLVHLHRTLHWGMRYLTFSFAFWRFPYSLKSASYPNQSQSVSMVSWYHSITPARPSRQTYQVSYSLLPGFLPFREKTFGVTLAFCSCCWVCQVCWLYYASVGALSVLSSPGDTIRLGPVFARCRVAPSACAHRVHFR